MFINVWKWKVSVDVFFLWEKKAHTVKQVTEDTTKRLKKKCKSLDKATKAVIKPVLIHNKTNCCIP